MTALHPTLTQRHLPQPQTTETDIGNLSARREKDVTRALDTKLPTDLESIKEETKRDWLGTDNLVVTENCELGARVNERIRGGALTFGLSNTHSTDTSPPVAYVSFVAPISMDSDELPSCTAALVWGSLVWGNLMLGLVFLVHVDRVSALRC